MAWRYRTTSPVEKNTLDLDLTVSVEFFDDGDVDTVLHQRKFRFAPGTTRQGMLDEILQVGRAARTVVERRDAINAQFPVGTSGPIT